MVGPEVGLTPVTVGSGGAVKVNWSAGAFATEVPPGVVTVTSTVAAASAGEMTVIDVARVDHQACAAVVPNLTTVAPVKPVPVTVTGVPAGGGPASRAHAGDGGNRRGVKVNWSAGAFTTEVPPAW